MTDTEYTCTLSITSMWRSWTARNRPHGENTGRLKADEGSTSSAQSWSSAGLRRAITVVVVVVDVVGEGAEVEVVVVIVVVAGGESSICVEEEEEDEEEEEEEGVG